VSALKERYASLAVDASLELTKLEVSVETLAGTRPKDFPRIEVSARDFRRSTGVQTLFAPDTAARIPCRMRTGLGGHPGTATSTGITFEMRPRLA